MVTTISGQSFLTNWRTNFEYRKMEIVARIAILFLVTCCAAQRSSPQTSFSQDHGADPECLCRDGSWTTSCYHAECHCVPDGGPAPMQSPSMKWSSLETRCDSQRAADTICGQVVILRLSRCTLNGSLLYLEHFAKFPHLRELQITALRWSDGLGRLRLLNSDVKFAHVTVLDLSGNGLRSVHQAALHAFTRLELLYLDDNNLASLDGYNFADGWNLSTISLSGNDWLCSEMGWFVEWMRAQPPEVRPHMPNANATWCHHTDHRNGTGRTTLVNLIERCPKKCNCTLTLNQVQVDCSHRRLRQFPNIVPVNASTIDLRNNSIDSLKSLADSNSYANLRHLYLDNNSISSIDLLDKAVCFRELVRLTLSGNQLRMINWIIIESLIGDVHTQVNLSNNPWTCECNSVSKFYDLLVKYSKKISDIDEIRCADNGTQMARAVIYKLKKFQLCSIDVAGYHPSDIIDPIIAILIIVIVVKVTYDFFKFKYSGKLPFGPLDLCQRGSRFSEDVDQPSPNEEICREHFGISRKTSVIVVAVGEVG